MARVKGIGELDWFLYGIDDFDGERKEGPVFGSNDAISSTDGRHESSMDDQTTFRLQFRLIPGNQPYLEALFFIEELNLDVCPAIVEICPTVEDIGEKLRLDLKPCVLTEGVVRLFLRISSELDIDGIRATLFRPGIMGIEFDVIVKEVPVYPDKYLHALARKMSKWAKE